MPRVKVEVQAEYSLPLLAEEPLPTLLGLEHDFLARELQNVFGWDAKVTFKVEEIKD